MDLYSAGLKGEDLTTMHEGKGQFRILVVENEAKVACALREGLEPEKYGVVVPPVFSRLIRKDLTHLRYSHNMREKCLYEDSRAWIGCC
jgi:hypothetical protein